MTSNRKVVNYKVVDLIDFYNFYINIVSIRHRIKKLRIYYHSRVVAQTGSDTITAESEQDPAVIVFT